VPKVTFLPAGTAVAFERAHLPFGGHGKPGSLLDVALHFFSKTRWRRTFLLVRAYRGK